MRKSIPFALGLVVALICAVAVAQTIVMANGKVITTSPSALVIETQTGERLNFVVDADSTIPTGIVIGNPVTVDYTRMEDGSLHVSKVSLVDTPSGQALVQETETIPAPAPTTVTEPAPAPAPVTADADPYDADDEALPQTASPLALLALAGFTALGGSRLARWARKR